MTVDIPSQKEGVKRAIRLSPEITATLLHPHSQLWVILPLVPVVFGKMLAFARGKV